MKFIRYSRISSATFRNRRIWSRVFRGDVRRSSCRNGSACTPGRDPRVWTTIASTVCCLGCWTSATWPPADTTCRDRWKARPTVDDGGADKKTEKRSRLRVYRLTNQFLDSGLTWIGMFMHPKKSSWLPDLALWAICLKNRPSPLTPLTSFSLLTASNTDDSSSWSLRTRSSTTLTVYTFVMNTYSGEAHQWWYTKFRTSYY